MAHGQSIEDQRLDPLSDGAGPTGWCAYRFGEPGAGSGVVARLSEAAELRHHVDGVLAPAVLLPETSSAPPQPSATAEQVRPLPAPKPKKMPDSRHDDHSCCCVWPTSPSPTPSALRLLPIGDKDEDPTATWVTQTIKNLVMDLEDAGATVKFPILDRDAKFPALIDEILADSDIQTVLTSVRVPRMNSIMERWIQSCRHELLDRTLVWNEHHLRHALREYEKLYNSHRAHQAKHQEAPLRPVPAPITDPNRIAHLNIRRHDRLGGVLHEYLHAA